MKIKPQLFMIFLILTTACHSPSGLHGIKSFEKNITYFKSGGWINHYMLKIDSSGSVQAVERSHDAFETIDSAAAALMNNEMIILARLFSSFDDLEDHYQPEQYYTDQNYHRIIQYAGSENDTTSVYDPPHCNLPGNLEKIIEFMEEKTDQLLN